MSSSGTPIDFALAAAMDLDIFFIENCDEKKTRTHRLEFLNTPLGSMKLFLKIDGFCRTHRTHANTTNAQCSEGVTKVKINIFKS